MRSIHNDKETCKRSNFVRHRVTRKSFRPSFRHGNNESLFSLLLLLVIRGTVNCSPCKNKRCAQASVEAASNQKTHQNAHWSGDRPH